VRKNRPQGCIRSDIRIYGRSQLFQRRAEGADEAIPLEVHCDFSSEIVFQQSFDQASAEPSFRLFRLDDARSALLNPFEVEAGIRSVSFRPPQNTHCAFIVGKRAVLRSVCCKFVNSKCDCQGGLWRQEHFGPVDINAVLAGSMRGPSITSLIGALIQLV